MSVIENFRPKPRHVLNSADAIAAKLTDAENSLADLAKKIDDASYDALADVTGGKDRLAALQAEADAIRANIATLQSGLRGAKERDKLAALALKSDMTKSAIKSINASLGVRDKSADLFAAAIYEASKHYRQMLESTERAKQAWTALGMEYPRGHATTTEIVRLAAGEMFRHSSGQIGGDPLTLPAPAPSEFEYSYNPGAMPRIDDTLRKDSEWIKEQISKLVPK